MSGQSANLTLKEAKALQERICSSGTGSKSSSNYSEVHTKTQPKK